MAMDAEKNANRTLEAGIDWGGGAFRELCGSLGQMLEQGVG